MHEEDYEEEEEAEDEEEEVEEFDDDDFNSLLEDTINYVASQFDKDSTFDEARNYAEQTWERAANLGQRIADAVDDASERLSDPETKRAWWILEEPRRHFNFGSEQLAELTGEENEEPFDLGTLSSLQGAWQEYFRDKAGAQMYQLEWLTPSDLEDNEEVIILEALGDEELFGYDGKYVYMDPDEDVREVVDALREKGSDFTPNAEVQELLDLYNLNWGEVLDWLPGGHYGDAQYISPFGMYGGVNGTWYIVIDQGEVWSLLDDSINDDEWLAEAIQISEYDEEVLEAWRRILFGGEAGDIKKLVMGEPEEERIMGFEMGKGGGQFEFFDLLNAAAIKKQGSKLGQCVGNRQYGYIDAVAEGEQKIISMRTGSGKPKFTIQAILDEDGNISSFGEIKGSHNRIPGFSSHDPSKGKFKPVEVDVLLAFAENIDPPVSVIGNEDMTPALARLAGERLERLPARRNPREFRCCSWCGR